VELPTHENEDWTGEKRKCPTCLSRTRGGVGGGGGGRGVGGGGTLGGEGGWGGGASDTVGGWKKKNRGGEFENGGQRSHLFPKEKPPTRQGAFERKPWGVEGTSPRTREKPGKRSKKEEGGKKNVIPKGTTTNKPRKRCRAMWGGHKAFGSDKKREK